MDNLCYILDMAKLSLPAPFVQIITLIEKSIKKMSLISYTGTLIFYMNTLYKVEIMSLAGLQQNNLLS